MITNITRREVLSAAIMTPIAMGCRGAFANDKQVDRIVIDPTPKHDLSPYLYMQFMEPLGATDGSVEAAWDHIKDRWRPDVIAATQELGPTMMRWGGIFTDFYRWREGVGPRSQRKPMLNLLWGGIESNQIGTAEFVDFCRQVKADPLMCVNFESDGRKRYMKDRNGIRTADAKEAAQWVAYCNQEGNAERVAHGRVKPYNIRHWQIGNETSHDKRGFNLETAARKTVEFATAMKKSDGDIELIAWGDHNWGPRMIEVAGEHIKHIAIHHMYNPGGKKNPVLGNLKYREDPDRTWDVMMDAVKQHEKKITQARQMIKGTDINIALTECHYSIKDRDRCDVLSSWVTGVSYARLLNLHQRHGDVLKIATAADFCGNRWQVNAVMIPTPAKKGKAFLMPVARVMSLYRHHTGKQFVSVSQQPGDLDITASRTGNRMFLHVANLNRSKTVRAKFDLGTLQIKSGKAFEIAAPSDAEITRFRPHMFDPKTKEIRLDQPWEFPAASVTAIELECKTPII
jgi:alpha-L-arabinofuranosidase